MKTIKTINLSGQNKGYCDAKFDRVSDQEAEMRVKSSDHSERVTYSTKSAYRRQAKVEK